MPSVNVATASASSSRPVTEKATMPTSSSLMKPSMSSIVTVRSPSSSAVVSRLKLFAELLAVFPASSVETTVAVKVPSSSISICSAVSVTTPSDRPSIVTDVVMESALVEVIVNSPVASKSIPPTETSITSEAL